MVQKSEIRAILLSFFVLLRTSFLCKNQIFKPRNSIPAKIAVIFHKRRYACVSCPKCQKGKFLKCERAAECGPWKEENSFYTENVGYNVIITYSTLTLETIDFLSETELFESNQHLFPIFEPLFVLYLSSNRGGRKND